MRYKLKHIAVLIILPFLFISCDKNNDSELIDGEDEQNISSYVVNVADIMLDNETDHEDASDYEYQTSDMVNIYFNETSISSEGPGVKIDGNKITVQESGNYQISGILSDGQVVVETEDEGVVRLILNGVTLHHSTSAPIYIAQAEKTVIILMENSENYVSDAETYVYEDPEADEPNAAIFSKDDLSISGQGSLTVEGNYNDGIASKDGLVISGGNIQITSVDDGIRGKDYLVLKDTHITLDVAGDGLKSDNDEDASKGYILIQSGTYEISSGGDAIEAETDVLIANGTISIVTGGGSNQYISDDESVKGIKGNVYTVIDQGDFLINSADDAIHSNDNMCINEGRFEISTGDDGFHADTMIGMNGGEIWITDCYEGIESAVIKISNGNIFIHSDDDGINVAGGNDGSGFIPGPGGPGPDNFAASNDYLLWIGDGDIAVYANGDGIDSNGSIIMSGGNVIIHGPTESMNSALDYQISFKITNGFLIAAGSSRMAQIPDLSSSQSSVLFAFSTQNPETLVHLQNTNGQEIFSFAPSKNFQSIAFSSPELKIGSSYELYFGGSSSGTEEYGLYEDGTYTPGNKIGTITINKVASGYLIN